MTTTFLPLVAIALALAATFSATKGEQLDPTWTIWRLIWASVLSASLLAAAYFLDGYSTDAWYAACGFSVSALALAALSAVGRTSGMAISLGLAAAVAGVAHWLPAEHRLFGQLGAAAGAALAAWLLFRDDEPDLWLLSAFVATLIAVDILGARSVTGRGFEHSGSMLGLVAAAAATVGRYVGRSQPPARALAALGLMALGAVTIGQRYLGIQDAWTLTIAGLLAGVVTHWLLAEDRTDLLNLLISAILWVGLATLGFALRRGYGMSLCLFGGFAALALLGNRRGLLALGPLAGLVFYRVFREMHIDATRSLDIGQHYALIGMLIGAILPLLPLDWRSDLGGDATSTKAGVMRLLWTVLLIGIPLFIGSILGPKGIVGFVAGLGFAAIIEAIRGKDSLAALGLGTGLAFTSTILYGWLGDYAKLTREEKLSALWPLAAALLVLAITIALLSPRKATSVGAKAS